MPSRTRDVDLWIKEATANSSIMVISGMGAIGKTTIAKFVYNGNYNDFDDCSFLSNMRERSKVPKGLIDLQKQLLSDICKRKKEQIYNVDRGIYVIRDALGCKRVLLVLDDVDHIDQINAIFRMQDSFFPGSKIVITTRNENLIKPFGVYVVYNVRTLGHAESIELFCLTALPQSHPTDIYMEQIQKIVNLCEGLPLALHVLSSSLIGKKLDVWVALSKKLETIPNGDVVEKLKISYDSLPDDDVKNIFLYISCFFSGEDYDHTVEILDACEMHTVVGIDLLLDRCLLEIDSNKNIRMHQSIIDMGRYIVCKESPHVSGKRSRLWRSQDCFDVLRNKTGTIKIKALAFNMEGDKDENLYGMDFNTVAFAKMQELEYLKLNYVNLTGSYEEFPKGLRWLSWHRCHFECVPNELSLQSLVCLDMQHSSLIQLWKDSECLPALKILNLSHSRRLTTSPDFSKLPKLKKLILKGCTELDEICEFIIFSAGLVLLDVNDCRKLTKLPRNISKLISLETLIISGCSGLEEFPVGLGNLKLLKLFHADGVDMHALLPPDKGLPSVASFPQFIEELSLANCKLSNDSLLIDLFNFLVLKNLNLDGNLFTSLPDFCQTLSKLQKLCINSCPLLQSITGLPRNIIYLLNGGGYTESPDCSHVSYLECYGCRSLIEVEGCYKKVSIRYVDRRIKKNLGFLELEQSLLDLGVYKYIKVKHEYGIFSMWVPGDKLPGCFSFKEKDTKTISFTVPNKPKIQGLTVGFVFGVKQQKGHYAISVTIYNQTRRMKWSYGVNDYSHNGVVWLLYFKLGSLLQAGDEVTAYFIHAPNAKEFGVKVVYQGENDDDDDEVYDTDSDHNKLMIEQNNSTHLSLDDQSFLQLSDFHVAGTDYLFGSANVDFDIPKFLIYRVDWGGWFNIPPLKYLKYSDEPDNNCAIPKSKSNSWLV